MSDFNANQRCRSAPRRRTDPAARPLQSPVAGVQLSNLLLEPQGFPHERPVNLRARKPPFSRFPVSAQAARQPQGIFPLRPARPREFRPAGELEPGAGLWQNLRDMISPPKLPPLKITSQPVAVKEIWSKNTQFTRVQALSIAFHVLVLVLIIVPLLPDDARRATTKANSRWTSRSFRRICRSWLPPPRKPAAVAGRRA